MPCANYMLALDLFSVLNRFCFVYSMKYNPQSKWDAVCSSCKILYIKFFMPLLVRWSKEMRFCVKKIFIQAIKVFFADWSWRLLNEALQTRHVIKVHSFSKQRPDLFTVCFNKMIHICSHARIHKVIFLNILFLNIPFVAQTCPFEGSCRGPWQ